MQRTPEQQAIVAHCRDTRDHLIVEARAGSGKTATLFEIVEEVESTFFIGAYNKAIATELQGKAARRFNMLKKAELQISTVHSHGLRAFTKNGFKSKILGDKLSFMLKDQLNVKFSSSDDIWRNMGKIRQLVSHAKGAGVGLTSAYETFGEIDDYSAWASIADHHRIFAEIAGKTPEDVLIEQAMRLMKDSIQRTNAVDFDDMIYLPLYLNLTMPTYRDVLIDEAQDINATRRELMFRSVQPRDGRLIAVGDPYQAIYGFTGADTDSLNNIERRAQSLGNVARLPLTICWRCDADIIASANKQVPDIKARPNAPSGTVKTIDFAEDNFLDLPTPGDAILCRLNKPNIAVCLGLLRRGVRARIEGRDIGERLLTHVRKSTDAYAHQDLSLTILDLENYRDVEIGKLVQKNKPESTIAMIEDEIEAAMLLCERASEVQEGKADYSHVAALVADLFGDDLTKASVVLSSIHKAKGREWRRVFILGFADWMPFFAAKADWEKVQEQNLIYVGKTRAEKELIFVNGAKDAIEAGLHRKVASQAPKAPNGAALEATLPPALGLHMPDLSAFKKGA